MLDLILPDLSILIFIIGIACVVALWLLTQGIGSFGCCIAFVIVLFLGIALCNDPSARYDPARNISINVTDDLTDPHTEQRWNGKFYTTVEADTYYVRTDDDNLYETRNLSAFNILNKKGQHQVYLKYGYPYNIEKVYW